MNDYLKLGFDWIGDGKYGRGNFRRRACKIAGYPVSNLAILIRILIQIKALGDPDGIHGSRI